MPTFNRRQAAAALPFFLQPPASAAAMPPTDFPREDSRLANEVVGAAHFDEKKVRALVDTHPSLANAWWDWGFGDWESPLGAASHVGRTAIAEYLLEKGARLDVFAATMLGMTDVVKAMVTARPGIQKTWGPHGITLLAHAKAGGARAESTLHYLHSLGDAGIGPATTPVPDERRNLILGKYEIEGRAVEIRQTPKGVLQIVTGAADGARNLFYKGSDVYFPSGVPSVGFRFDIREGKSVAFTILNPDAGLVAKRID